MASDVAPSYYTQTAYDGLDSLEVDFVGRPTAAAVELAEDASEGLASVVYGGIAPRAGDHHFARLEHQCSCLGLVLVDQANDLRNQSDTDAEEQQIYYVKPDFHA